MKSKFWTTRSLRLAFIGCTMLFFTSANAQDPVTVGAFVEGSRSALNDTIDKAREAGQELLVEAAIHANGLVDRIERIAKDQISKPISSLDQNLQNEIAATRQTVEAVRSTAASLPRCIGDEAQTALASLKSGVQTALNTLPAVQGEPVAYLVQAASSRAPYAVVRKPKSDMLLMLRGANLWTAEQKCSISARAKSVSGIAKAVPLIVQSSDVEKVMLTMPASIPNGEWLVEVSVQRKRTLIGCILPTEETISAPIQVRSPVELEHTVIVTPACKGYTACRQHVEGSCTNGSRRRDKHCQGVYAFNDSQCQTTGAEEWNAGGRCGNGVVGESSGMHWL